MTPERWRQITELFHAARGRDAAQRDALLADACREDPALQREVAAMLAGAQNAGAFGEAPLFPPASRLEPGCSLGPYRIERLIGAGGMGEVYRARDTTLGRDVAIKILPHLFTSDPDRLARFEREARMLAALNHPHIGAIYGVEDANGVRGLVLELVEGPTLADRLTAGPLPVTETLTIARQIADALDAAHERGIIHRDLKPANVKVTSDGSVKILDFGLAKAFAGDGTSEDVTQSPTLSRAATQQGVILGTAAYMSPEQARGQAVDKRTDIWAFGCVLYELLTGKPAFQGDTVTEILAAVLRGEPEWPALPVATPTTVRTLLRRCLQKDKTPRLRDAGDASIEIQEALAALSGDPTTMRQAAKNWQRPLLVGPASLLLGGLLTGLAVWSLKPAPPPAARPVTRFTITLPPGRQLAGEQLPGVRPGSAISLSSDGSHLAYVASQGGTQQLYLRAMDGLDARSVAGTDGAVDPFFSPDGQELGFFAGGKLKKVSVSGGAVIPLGDASWPRGASWGSDRMIAFVPSIAASLQQVSDAGGAPQPLTRLEKGEAWQSGPEFLPGGKAVLFGFRRQGGVNQIAVQSVETGDRRSLIAGGTQPQYALSGHLVYAQGGNLMAVPFDLQRLAVTGPPVLVVEDVLQEAASAQYSVSATGSLVYAHARGNADSLRSVLVWVDRHGTEQALPAEARAYNHPRLSPDGQRVALTIGSDDGQEGNIWVDDLVRNILTKLTVQGGYNDFGFWTPDGRRITFISNREGQLQGFWQWVNGSGGPERLTSGENAQHPNSWHPDGQQLAITERNPTTGYDIWVKRIGDHQAQPFLRTPSNEFAAQFSPDGRWLAYVSDETGRNEIYVQPYPGTGGKWQLSTDGGTEAVWNRNGRELFYRRGNAMMAVEIATHPGFVAGSPRKLVEGPYRPTRLGLPNYDVSADGQRFLMVKPSEEAQAAPTQINVVLNWSEELKQKVPTGLKK
jgi:serine/threonine protein kinase/Tol biopolymer transport system component